MSRLYKEKILGVLQILHIDPPEHLAEDQSQIEDLMVSIKTALDTYDPLPTGNAVRADVLFGKTFSNATALGLVGACTYDADTRTGDAIAEDIFQGKTAYVAGARVVGTSLASHKLITENVAIATPALSEAMTTALLAASANAIIALAYGGDVVQFARVSKKVDDSEIYLVGGSSTALGVPTLFSMTLTVALGVATIASIKTSAGVEDIANWAASTGAAYVWVTA